MNGLRKDSATLVTVGEEAAGQRIDNFLCRILKGVPKSHVYRILRSGEVRVNKGRAGPERRLEAGDVVRRVRAPLHKFSTREGERRVRVEEGGQTAETIFRRIAVWSVAEPPLALLEAELMTGRTHQIRVHLQHLGHALAGDDKYGDF